MAMTARALSRMLPCRGWLLAAGLCLAGPAVPAMGPAAAAEPALGGSPSLALPSAPPSVGLLRSGLLDLSRFELRHSLSYGFTSGAGMRSRSGGLWVSELGYRLADPLRVSVALGATLDPGGESLLDEKSFFLQGLHLDYRPSRNFHLSVSYVNTPPTAARALGYGAHPDPFGRRSWSPSLRLDR